MRTLVLPISTQRQRVFPHRGTHSLARRLAGVFERRTVLQAVGQGRPVNLNLLGIAAKSAVLMWRQIATKSATRNFCANRESPQGVQNSLRLLVSLLAFATLLLIVPGPTAASDLETFRLRIAWGGGDARQWSGTLSVDRGTLSDVRPLGLDADCPGSILPVDDHVAIRQLSARSYDGFDVTVRAPLDAKLSMLLAPVSPPAGQAAESPARTSEPLVHELPLADLMSGRFNRSLDQSNNRLLIRRAPGDVLRVEFAREHLVFDPGEKFRLKLHTYRTNLGKDTSVRLRLRTFEARSNRQLSQQHWDSRIDEQGSLPPQDAVVTLPDGEGVYDLVVDVTKRTFGQPWFAATAEYERRLQVVVIDDGPQAVRELGTPAERPVVDIDPTVDNWYNRLLRPQLKLIGWDDGPIGSEKPQIIRHRGQPFVEMSARGWHAYPLPIVHPGRPHLLEVEYPGDIPQSLGVTVFETNAAGIAIPTGVDAALQISGDFSEERAVRKHRLVFWPGTESPMLLISNRGASANLEDREVVDAARAVFGRVRVFEMPEQPVAGVVPPQPERQRLAVAYYDQPLFCENFSAREVFDVSTSRALDDWVTFYDGAVRLARYLRYAGYNAAAIPVATEGSSLYPSRLLQPTPRHDTGVFFGSGQDPVRKDVLEMLLRIFDREGLVLIPVVDFASPLPALERLEATGDADKRGLRLQGPGGHPWPITGAARAGTLYYNPLCEDVRTAMAAITTELVERSAAHRSFGGIAVRLLPGSYTQLPGVLWGTDQATIRRFEASCGVRVPPAVASAASTADTQNHNRREEFLMGAGQPHWLKWRSEQLAELYHEMARPLSQAGGHRRLFLLTAGLVDSPLVAETMRPALPRRQTLDDALIQMGIDVEQFADDQHIVLARPHRWPAAEPLYRAALDIEVNASPEVDRLFGLGKQTASQHVRMPLITRLTAFEQKSPFGSEHTVAYLNTHMVPEGAAARRHLVRTLANERASAIFMGGAMLPLGQEEERQAALAAFRKLPARPFETFEPPQSSGGASPQPIVLRTLIDRGDTYLYVLNYSPWPVSADIRLSGPLRMRLEPLAAGQQVPPLDRPGQNARWSFPLAPYGMVAVVARGAEVRPIDVQTTIAPQAGAQLSQQIRDLDRRAGRLKNANPLQVLRNPDFELANSTTQPAPRGRSIPGWVHSAHPQTDFQIDRINVHTGRQSLHIKTTGAAAWIRSDPFEAPTSGRLHVWVWLRAAQENTEPPLRLAVEGRLNGRVYYRFATVGTAAAPIGTKWAPFVFQVDDLPVEGLTDLRVGFDVMGPGEVWVDDVEVFDLSFSPGELKELSSKIIALADFHLRAGRVSDCMEVLSGYWPRFLMEHVSDGRQRMVAEPRDQQDRPADRQADRRGDPLSSSRGGDAGGRNENRNENRSEQPPSETEPSMFDRIKDRLTPRLPKLF